MTSNYISLLFLFIIEIILLILSCSLGLRWIRKFILLNMVSVLCLPMVMVDYHIGISNVENIWYAFSLTAIAIIIKRYGHIEGWHTCFLVLSTLIGTSVLQYLALSSPIINETENIIQTYKYSFFSTFNSLVPSFLGFMVSVSVLIIADIKLKISEYFKWILAFIIAQFLDSIVFFTILFSANGEYIEAMFVGFLIKVFINVLLVPLLVQSTFTENLEE